ncbi:MAG: aldo/keto reductase [Hyphomonadaceae bacterium]
MQYRRLGGSGLKVSAVGLGCNNFGMRITDYAQAETVVRAALDAGVTLFDTADAYGAQQSEVMLGKALGADRHKVVIATKFAAPIPGLGQGGSRRHVIAAAEMSLKRLGVDYIDLYQMHRPDAETPIEETLGALDDLVRAGKVRYIGCSNFSAWQIADADWLARVNRMNRFVSVQNEYSLLARGIEDEVLPACNRFGLGILPYYPLALGMLSGKYRRGETPPAGTRLSPTAKRIPNARDPLTAENFDRVDALTRFAEERGHTVLSLAFAWLLSRPAVSSVIAGATKPEQIRANVDAGEWRLSAEDVAEVDKLAA